MIFQWESLEKRCENETVQMRRWRDAELLMHVYRLIGVTTRARFSSHRLNKFNLFTFVESTISMMEGNFEWNKNFIIQWSTFINWLFRIFEMEGECLDSVHFREKMQRFSFRWIKCICHVPRIFLSIRMYVQQKDYELNLFHQRKANQSEFIVFHFWEYFICTFDNILVLFSCMFDSKRILRWWMRCIGMK